MARVGPVCCGNNHPVVEVCTSDICKLPAFMCNVPRCPCRSTHNHQANRQSREWNDILLQVHDALLLDRFDAEVGRRRVNELEPSLAQNQLLLT